MFAETDAISKNENTFTPRDCSYIAKFAVIFIVCISCLPLLSGYLPYGYGHDLVFHLYRIDGIANAISSGNFPVYIQTSQINGFGYPVSICYGDLFLYIPALLRVAGLSMKASYSLFVVLINSFCAVSSYIIVRRVSGSRILSVVACALWTWSPYRLLVDVWLRASVGEYLALAFLPLIMYGLYSIFFHDMEGASKRGWLWCALGVSGIVYSHVISIVLTVIVFLPLCLIMLVAKHDFRIIKSLGLACCFSLLLSLAFLIPFLDFYLNVNMKVTALTDQAKMANAAGNAIQPLQLLFFLPPVALHSTQEPTTNEMPYNLGWGILLSSIIFILILAVPSLRKRLTKRSLFFSKILLIMALIVGYGTTCYFPWKGSENHIANSIISVLATIQFPWRFVGPLTLLLIVVGVIALNILRQFSNSIFKICCGAIICISFVEVISGITSFDINASALPSNYKEGEQYGGVMNGEYLPSDVDLQYLLGLEPYYRTSDNVKVSDYEKRDSSISIRAIVSNGSGQIELPLLSYPYYRADSGAGTVFTLDKDENNLLVLNLPDGFNGEVHVYFNPPIYWRIAFFCSILTVLCLVIFCLKYSFCLPRRS